MDGNVVLKYVKVGNIEIDYSGVNIEGKHIEDIVREATGVSDRYNYDDETKHKFVGRITVIIETIEEDTMETSLKIEVKEVKDEDGEEL